MYNPTPTTVISEIAINFHCHISIVNLLHVFIFFCVSVNPDTIRTTRLHIHIQYTSKLIFIDEQQTRNLNLDTNTVRLHVRMWPLSQKYKLSSFSFVAVTYRPKLLKMFKRKVLTDISLTCEIGPLKFNEHGLSCLHHITPFFLSCLYLRPLFLCISHPLHRAICHVHFILRHLITLITFCDAYKL